MGPGSRIAGAAVVNALWGGANLVGGLLLARAVTGEGPEVIARREAFGLGVAAFSAWAVVGERIVRVSGPKPGTDE
jgi:hypothetical protein